MTYMLPILLASIWQHDRDWVLPYDICCANETFPQPSATHLKSLFRYAKLVNIGHMNEENPNAFHTSTTNSKIKLLCPEEQQSEARLGRGSQYLTFCNVRICLLVQSWLLQRHFLLSESHRRGASSCSAQWQGHRLKLIRHGWRHPSTITTITSRKQSLPHKCNMIILDLISRGQSKDLQIVQFNFLNLALKRIPMSVCVYICGKKCTLFIQDLQNRSWSPPLNH